MKYSKNATAGKVAGKRNIPPNTIIFDQPAELGYICPICQNEAYHKDEDYYDGRLQWSEYKGFLWCSVCNLDIPSCLCVPGLNKKGRKRGTQHYQHCGLKDAIKIYLASVQDAQDE